MFGHGGLIEKDAFFRVHTAGDKACAQFARVAAQGFGILPDGDRVQIHHAINGLVGACVLHCDKPLERAKIVPQRQPARGLDAREHARREGGLGHGRLRLDVKLWVAYP